MSDLEAHAQLLCALVQKKNGKDLVIDDPPHQFRDPLQKRVKIKRGIQGSRKVEEEPFEIQSVWLLTRDAAAAGFTRLFQYRADTFEFRSAHKNAVFYRAVQQLWELDSS